MAPDPCTVGPEPGGHAPAKVGIAVGEGSVATAVEVAAAVPVATGVALVVPVAAGVALTPGCGVAVVGDGVNVAGVGDELTAADCNGAVGVEDGTLATGWVVGVAAPAHAPSAATSGSIRRALRSAIR
ncbi:MAG: hypothetical protein ABIP53_11020 [Candidatus Limnocylindrales bacterium]